MAFMQKTAHLTLLLIIFFKSWVFCVNVDQLRESVSVQEQRAFIKISVLLDKEASVIHHELETALGGRAYSLRRVRELTNEYRSGERISCENLPRSGHPVTADTPENRERLQALMAQSRAWVLDDLSDNLGISVSTVWCMLQHLGYRKVASKYVPHTLTSSQMQARVDACKHNLERYEQDSTLLHRIVAIDETWLRSYDPKDPKTAAEWTLPHEKS